MRFANLGGRLALVTGDGAVDVQKASNGELPADPTAAFEVWDDVLRWAAATSAATEPYEQASLGAPVPHPGQVFAIGLNYRAHAEEAGFDIPTFPTTFTKFPSCLTGPYGEVAMPSEFVDWEVELVAVIGRTAHDLAPGTGWRYVAGLTAGQDISERRVQHRKPSPQWSLGKSYPGFGPTGPYLVTPDEFADPDAIGLRCRVNGDVVQESNTADLIFPVPRLVEHLSSVVTLQPGDLIFTGTPPGVGHARTPERFLGRGDELVTEVDGIGEMRHVLR